MFNVLTIMYYIEVNFITSQFESFVTDMLTGLLADIGFDSFSENEQGLIAYIPKDKFDESLLRETLEDFPIGNHSISYTLKEIPPTNWNEEWEKHYFEPILIENKCIIHSSFHQNIPQVDYDILIDPKMAFGTGHHETTSLMLAELLELDLQKKSFLDMGCGTAVLAILASMKGASPVVAIDIDEWAFENALENIALNNTNTVQVKKGGAELLQNEGTFDYIFANINRNILLNDMEAYAACMHHGSVLYMSGFYVQDIPAITDKASSLGLLYNSFKEKNNWAAIHFVKS